MASSTSSELTALFPSTSYLLAYSLPLLLLSLVLTFAGAFLTLDRTRSFAPKYDTLPGAFDTQSRKKAFRFALEGGVGGLIVGYAFGLHLATFLALLVPAVSTSAASLRPKSFIPVWLLSSLLTTFLGGRWKCFALGFAGIAGGCLFSLGLCVIIHPSLLTRLVLIGIFTPISFILAMLPLVKIQRPVLRFVFSSTGAFGVILSIALLSNIPAWANVWERLWVNDGASWGTSKEQGLSAGFCLFLFAGIVSDWLLRRTFGECPDEKWDSYLANYATNLPNQADRAGTFQPLTSVWDRIFGKGPSPKKEIIFPDTDSKVPLPISSPMKLHKYDPSSESDWKHGTGHLKKSRSKRYQGKYANNGRRCREAIKFRPLDDLSDLSDSSEDEMPKRPWLKQKPSMTSTTPTLVDSDYEKEIKKLKTRFTEGEVPEYSDYEEDVTSAAKSSDDKDDSQEKWSPKFIKKQQRSSSGTTAIASDTPMSPVPFGAVPATPSLIKALDRVAMAQRDAFQQHSPSGLPPVSEAGTDWEGFWRDVSEKNEKADATNATNATTKS